MRHFLFFILSFIFLHLNANSQDVETLMLCHEKQVQLADSLYKNYLPQTNFEEVKSAVTFYDSLFDNASKAYKRKLSKQKNDFHFKRAKAHYYHAVGLLEQEETAGACRHFLKALEIMKVYYPKETDCINKNVKAAELDETQYRRVRFVSLLYNRLGEVFYENNYVDLALKKYKFAIKYCDILEERDGKAAILMQIGNSYHVLNKDDSTLYFYNESLKISSNSMFKLDIDKTKARILFDRGEKDTAYAIIKNNLSKLDENYLPRYSYYNVLGDFYFEDKEYDSAIYYWEKGAASLYYYTKLACIESLSKIYDSIGDDEKKAYYDGITAKLSLEGLDKSLEKTSLQNVYSEYTERMNGMEKSENRIKTAVILILLMILSVSCMIVLRAGHRKRLAEKTDIIENNERIISETISRLEIKDSEISDREEIIEQQKKEIGDKDEIINRQQQEILDFNSRTERVPDMEAFRNSEICRKITSRKANDFSPLSNDDLAQLLQSANANLGGIVSRLTEDYPDFDEYELYCICLILLNVEYSSLQILLHKDRKTIYRRISNIKEQFKINVEANSNLHSPLIRRLVKRNYLPGKKNSGK